jgi:8-oxo-dGTP pyrophosphatase MutT (NUDIX family)
MAELWDIYDENRVKTGRTVERGQPMAPDDFHIVVNAWLTDGNGQWLISKRAPNKPYPNMWECTGGSALAGEDSLTAALREVKEELGITLNADAGRLFHTQQRRGGKWPDFADTWIFDCDIPIENVVLQENETCDAMWATSKQILQMLDSGEFIGRDIFTYIDRLLDNEDMRDAEA